MMKLPPEVPTQFFIARYEHAGWSAGMRIWHLHHMVGNSYQRMPVVFDDRPVGNMRNFAATQWPMPEYLYEWSIVEVTWEVTYDQEA